ncbi:MAG: Fic family protein [Akkermansia sp.]
MTSVLNNILGIDCPIELAKQEERISKLNAKELYELGLLNSWDAGCFASLQKIHAYLFGEIYRFAGHLRSVNIAKGNFRFASVMFLEASLQHIDMMPQSTFEQIMEKYVEMNVAHPFCEGNGRSTRIWLDCMLKQELGLVVDWSRVDKNDYLMAMERSPIKDIEIKHVIKQALTDQTEDRALYMKGIDHSYSYEGYSEYKTENL